MNRASKPRPKSYTYYSPYSKETTTAPLVEVHEDWYAEQFADPGDIQCTRIPKIYGYDYLFEDMSYAEQAEHAEVLGKWLLQYSKWIKTRKRKEDPNAN